MFRKTIKDLLKLSASPPNIIYPLPLVPTLIFSFSNNKNIFNLIYLILLSSIYYAGINLWNHVNDVEEDRLIGRTNILIESHRIRVFTAILSIFLYFISLFLLIIKIVDSRGIIFYIIVFILTWLYSDRVIFGRYIGRLKNHYITEFLAFAISIPSYTLMLWCVVSKITIRAVFVALCVTSLMLSGTFLKDMKDITGDELAGLKTLAVVFDPKKLLKLFYVGMWIYYIIIIFAISTSIFNVISAIAVIPIFALIYTTYKTRKNHWEINETTVKYIKITVCSSVLSIFLLTLSGFLSPTWC